MTDFMYGIAVGAFVMGLVCFIIRLVRTCTGTLLIDHSNPEKDVYLFKVNDLDKLSKKKEVHLLIVNNANLSQD